MSAEARDAGAVCAGAPLSARACDGACVAFALWTGCAHAIVAAGGSLQQLIALYPLVLALALAAWLLLRRRGMRSEPDAATSAEPPPRRGRVRRGLRWAGLLLGVAGALFFHLRGDVVFLWFLAVGLLGVAAAAFVAAEKPLVEPAARSHGLELGLWMLALACVGITLVCHRPDLDDAFYVNVAVTAADFPDRPLLVADSLHGVPDLPLLLPVYRLHSYELLNGALAYASGRPAIEIFHWLAASLAALFVPLAHARLFRLLVPRHWLWASAAVVVVLVAAGETHRWYGNFAFARMWQGKAIYLFVFLPLVYAYALRFALRPRLSTWLLLAAAQIAALGCTSSALWGAPVGALLALCCVVRPTRAGLRVFALGALASLYVLALGWLMKETLAADGYDPSTKEVWETGTQLEKAFAVVLGNERLLALAVAAMLASWAFCRRGLAQRFAIVFPLGVALVLLDPFTDRWVVANVTGSAYWRTLWALPIPILMALLLVSPLQLGRGRAGQMAAAATALLLVVAFATLIPRFAALSEKNVGATGVGIRIGRPGLKVPDAPWRWAKALNDSVPPGSRVIAPDYISVWIPTFHHHAHPLEVRSSYLQEYRNRLDPRDIQVRHLLGRFALGESENENDAEVFRSSLDRFDVKAVCLRRSPRTPQARRILRGAGFHQALADLRHEIWVRSSQA